MNEAWICEMARTPIGRYGGTLASVRPDDLAVAAIRGVMARQSQIDWAMLDDVILGPIKYQDSVQPAVDRLQGCPR